MQRRDHTLFLLDAEYDKLYSQQALKRLRTRSERGGAAWFGAVLLQVCGVDEKPWRVASVELQQSLTIHVTQNISKQTDHAANLVDEICFLSTGFWRDREMFGVVSAKSTLHSKVVDSRSHLQHHTLFCVSQVHASVTTRKWPRHVLGVRCSVPRIRLVFQRFSSAE